MFTAITKEREREREREIGYWHLHDTDWLILVCFGLFILLQNFCLKKKYKHELLHKLTKKKKIVFRRWEKPR